MTYAFLTDGLDAEQRAQFDKTVEQGAQVRSEKAQAKREREAIESLMNLPGMGRR